MWKLFNLIKKTDKSTAFSQGVLVVVLKSMGTFAKKCGDHGLSAHLPPFYAAILETHTQMTQGNFEFPTESKIVWDREYSR